jgi:hypothetical protein
MLFWHFGSFDGHSTLSLSLCEIYDCYGLFRTYCILVFRQETFDCYLRFTASLTTFSHENILEFTFHILYQSTKKGYHCYSTYTMMIAERVTEQHSYELQDDTTHFLLLWFPYRWLSILCCRMITRFLHSISLSSPHEQKKAQQCWAMMSNALSVFSFYGDFSVSVFCAYGLPFYGVYVFFRKA